MNKSQEFLKEITEVSQRRKLQLEDQLKDFKTKIKTVSGPNKKVIEDAIKGVELSLQGKPVGDKLTKSIFKAIEL